MILRHGRRWFVLGALAVGPALLVAGLAALPAAAQTKQDAKAEANGFIGWCFRVGSDPKVVLDGTEADGSIWVRCEFANIDDVFYEFWPSGSSRMICGVRVGAVGCGRTRPRCRKGGPACARPSMPSG